MFETRTILTWVLILVAFICYCLLMIFLVMNSPTEKTYSCDIAEISPDYTVAMKEQCRKLRSGRI
jgi:hypothetical protein